MTKKPKHYSEADFLRLCEYLGEDLDSAACREVRDHVESCRECSLYFDSIRRMVEQYRDAEQPEKTPQDCRRRILDLITEKVNNRNNE